GLLLVLALTAVVQHPENCVRRDRVLRVVLGDLVDALGELLAQPVVLLDQLLLLLALGLVDLGDHLAAGGVVLLDQCVVLLLRRLVFFLLFWLVFLRLVVGPQRWHYQQRDGQTTQQASHGEFLRWGWHG